MTCSRMRETTWYRKSTMSSFFLPAKGSAKERRRKKRPLSDRKKTKTSVEKKARLKTSALDEEIASDSDAEEKREGRRGGKEDGGLGSGEEEEETAPEKRLRLAKEYLSQLEEEELKKEDLDIDHDAIAHRLRQDVLEQAGKLQRKMADLYCAPSVDSIRVLRGHQLSVTCVAMTPDDRYIYSGSKDCCIVKWDFISGKKEVIFPGRRGGIKGIVGHSGHVLALAVSSDGKFLASGGHDKVVHIWDVATNVHVHTFRGHRGTVSGLVFQRGTHELFSCSYDRTVKIWNVDEMAYVETLFGHQDSVAAIDCFGREKPVTAGMNDRTVRLWKVVDESQLVFHGHKSSIDCVKLINDDHFVTGSQDGSIALWSAMKKKPLISRLHHHQDEAGAMATENWITALSAYPSSDVIASGSNDGYICVWRCGENFRSLELLFSVPLHGYINALVFSHHGDHLIAGVGQEHRLGRWCLKDSKARNSIAIIPLLGTV